MKKIILERNKCIGCGTCSVLCPLFWEMNEDGRVDLKEAVKVENEKFEREVDDISCAQEAAQSCPMQCIQIND